MSSWVDSGLDAASDTAAPPARSSRTIIAVSAVTCRQAAMARPANGCCAAKRRMRPAISGMARSAYRMRASPSGASPGSATSACGGAGRRVGLAAVGRPPGHPAPRCQ